MPQAILIERHGGPEVLVARDVAVGDPGPRQVRLRHTRIGVNFHDVYVRSGLYRTLALPGTPGIEAVGVVEAVGADVPDLRPGDRVACVTGAYGVYASHRLIDAELLLRVPDGLSDTLVASALLRGLTVEMLVARVHRLQPGAVVLVHAAAGGVGQLLCQWASRLGATVIGTARTDAQIALATRAGCAHVLRYTHEDVPARVRELTDGRGVDVAYDGIGRDTFAGSLAALAFCGHLVNYGQASGPVPPFEVSALAAKSSTLSRPIIFHYLRDRAVREAMAARVFAALADGTLRLNAPREFALADAAAAHAAIESDGATAPLLLVP